MRCEACGHTMYPAYPGYRCIENTCHIGLLNLGDPASAERVRKTRLCGRGCGKVLAPGERVMRTRRNGEVCESCILPQDFLRDNPEAALCVDLDCRDRPALGPHALVSCGDTHADEIRDAHNGHPA